jgi:periplasmic copper chaperone A
MTRTRRSDRLPTRVLAASGTIAALLGLLAPSASAHVEAAPAQITAGTASTIQLTVEEGCGRAPTTELRVKLPAGFGTATAPTAPEGWTAEQVADVLTFHGPGLPADAPFTLAFTVTADPSIGGTIQPLPAVQICPGTDAVRWIDPVIAGQPEPEHPATSVTVLPAPPPTTVATTAAPTTLAPTTNAPTTPAPTTVAPTTAPTTTTAVQTAPTAPASTTATSLAKVTAPSPSGGASGSAVAVVVGVVAALSAGGGYILARRRKPGSSTSS